MKAGEVAEPAVGDSDVLLDVHAAGINMLDAKIRDGEFELILPYKVRRAVKSRPASVGSTV